MGTQVLIFNPFKSGLEKELVEIVNQDSALNYFCLHDFNLTNILGIIPNIIFFILDNNFSLLHSEQYKIENFLSRFPLIPVIGLFHHSYECEFYKKSIWHFLTSPLRKEDIFLTIKWYGSNKGYENKSVFSSLKKHAISDLFIGDCEPALKIKEKITKVAQYDANVLITGETGTGKELCAKMIHFLSDRSKNSFVPLNCGAVPEELFENELFGHKKGAYTNAESSEKGLIEEANNGTLFLDEIESLPKQMQVKLLRFLEDKMYKPLGQPNYNHADVRVVAAAKQDLWDNVKQNKFREDLFYRLNILNINLPLLKDRREDIPLLVSHFIKRFSKLYKKEVNGIRPLAMIKLLYHCWDGNIRELQNIIQEAIIMTTTGWIEDDNLNFAKNNFVKLNPLLSFKNAKQNLVIEFEKTYLNSLLTAFNGNLSQASRFAKKDRRAVIRLLKKYEIDPHTFKNHS